ncbi:MAG: cytochrome C [Gammaproteobacteria bacterium RIFOXYA12_FULL_61_12]|nr:MAG: cytochrome C [Gammaproteobacteria bacterium RIFOXYA12_FULL_61_12]OGT90051.1 MAG: cytochrome C [Gammaproteobacteria bacterium RIFOXYD12_FULL_61_37]
MKKLIIAFLMAAASSLAWSSEGPKLDKANVDLTDQASLQRGAKLFVNYCQGCHSLQFQRYQRMADDIGLTYDEVKQNLMFAGGKIGDTMGTSLDKTAAADWFGAPPPDLSVITRARGVDYIYTYLRSFYQDEKRPFGVNNMVFPDVGMPHVMAELQGVQKAKFSGEGSHKVFEGFELAKPGKMSAEEFDGAMRDLTAFLTYVGEPIQVKRQALGIYVLLFLALFTVLAYLMKKEYWKDVH